MAVNPQPAPGPNDPDLQDIQGNMVGFNKDHQRLVFLSFPTLPQARLFCRRLPRRWPPRRRCASSMRSTRRSTARAATTGPSRPRG